MDLPSFQRETFGLLPWTKKPLQKTNYSLIYCLKVSKLFSVGVDHIENRDINEMAEVTSPESTPIRLLVK